MRTSRMRVAIAVAGGLLMAGVTTGCPKQELNMAPVEAAASKTEAAANRAEKAAMSAADSAKRADAAAQAVEAMKGHPIGSKGKKRN